MANIKESAFEELNWAVKHRRFLHMYPELGMQEKNTSLYCQEVMRFLGYKIKKCWGYGFIADLIIDKTKKTIAWRTDMDALPVKEENTHSFVSKIPGVAHMCGHDAHMAAALLIAKLVVKNKKKLSCNVRFIFQPNEENPPGGALGMIKEGCLEDVDEIYGFHKDISIETGKIKIKEGAVTANVANFDLILKGKGTHAATPHIGLDPLLAAVNLINLWQSIITRRINATHFTLLSVSKFISGNIHNVISDKAELSGTVRSYSKEDMNLIEEFMWNSVKSLKMQGYKCEFDFARAYTSVINKEYGTKRVIEVAEKIVGKKNVDTKYENTLCGEDFSYYLQKVEGAFFFLGARNEEKNIFEISHSSKFDVDEDAIAIGAAIGLELILSS
ncbi:MAG: hypothetical protein AMS24_00190 [Chlamydiae bacterium SM23_39]|nr:MAG: hypothetical protein AMS24_00190 [Chlamydiae bacterium SM23_39]